MEIMIFGLVFITNFILIYIVPVCNLRWEKLANYCIIALIMPIDIQTFAFFVLSATVIIMAALIVRLEIRFRKMLRGKNARTLEDTIDLMALELKSQRKFQQEMEKYLGRVENRLKKSIQGVSTVRFNAFKNGGATGGNQSFASAFLNEKGDGLVISSLYSREVVGVYAKPISAGTSKYELTIEEKDALKQAAESALNGQ